MDELKQRLQQLGDSILDRDAAASRLLACCRELYDALANAARWDAEASDSQRRLQLADGVAIAGVEAARCILDSARTAAFLRGIDAALVIARARAGSRRLEILYAGCGPLAPLALGVQHRLPAGAARFWLVDAQPVAVRSAQALLHRLGSGDRFAAVECIDAARHHWPLRFDVVIVETMQRALEKEPQVAITANVARQLQPDGILVPESVELDLCFYDPSCEHASLEAPAERQRTACVPLVRLTAQSAAELRRDGAAAESEHRNAHALHAMVSTRLRVWADVTLEEYASAITLPLPAVSLGAIGAGQRVRAEFRAGKMPGTVITTAPPSHSPTIDLY